VQTTASALKKAERQHEELRIAAVKSDGTIAELKARRRFACALCRF
jgi:hypothetical protein